MRYVVTFIMMGLLTSNVFALDGSKLRINVRGNINSSQYVCISQVGCVNVNQGRGRALPLTTGPVSYIFLANGKNYRMYPQTLPASCNITVNNNQTLVVSGSVSKAANDNMYINQLRCSVVNA
jgi:hypothetical protein